MDTLSLFGVVAPAATPPEALDRLNALLVASARGPAVAARLSGLGFNVQASSREAFAATIHSEIAKWRSTIQQAGIVAD